MTKKDYIAIANVIKDSKKALLYATVNAGETKRAIQVITEGLAHCFSIDNNNFDYERFYSYVADETKRYKDFTDR